MDEWMAKSVTAPEVRTVIRETLLGWKHRGRSRAPAFTRLGFVDAIYAQERIGWEAFLKGCISTLWPGGARAVL